jgi:hypothetical protein
MLRHTLAIMVLLCLKSVAADPAGGRPHQTGFDAAKGRALYTTYCADIADIIDYERSSWGNHGKPVSAAHIAAERVHFK